MNITIQNNHLAKISANLERSVLPLSNGVLFFIRSYMKNSKTFGDM